MVGSNCLDERSAIAGLGPITVDPSIQDRGVGRKMMEAVLVRGRERNFPGIRVLQSAFHNRSPALYSRLGIVSACVCKFMDTIARANWETHQVMAIGQFTEQLSVGLIIFCTPRTN